MATAAEPSQIKSRKARFHDRMMDLYFSNPLEQNFFESLKPESEQNQEMISKNKQTMDIVYGFLNKHLKDHTWLNGKVII